MAIFRLHIPVLDEVKRKGLRTALNDKWWTSSRVSPPA